MPNSMGNIIGIAWRIRSCTVGHIPHHSTHPRSCRRSPVENIKAKTRITVHVKGRNQGSRTPHRKQRIAGSPLESPTRIFADCVFLFPVGNNVVWPNLLSLVPPRSGHEASWIQCNGNKAYGLGQPNTFCEITEIDAQGAHAGSTGLCSMRLGSLCSGSI